MTKYFWAVGSRPTSCDIQPASTARLAATVTTERLLLRSVRTGDVPAVTRLWTDPEVRRHLG
ncbi:hypothetical protein EAO71_01305, partial [Streptomyces sp. ms191]